MLQQPRGDWGSLSNKLLSESKQKFSTYLSGSADAAAPSQAQAGRDQTKLYLSSRRPKSQSGNG